MMQFNRSFAVAGLAAAIFTGSAGIAASAQTVNDVFTYTGANQSFLVPDGVTSLNVSLWGAGGGAGDAILGGGGAYVSGALSVTSGENLTVLVGGGGHAGFLGGNAGFGGGGTGFSGGNYGGGGGGRSGILDIATELVDAGAGGGGTAAGTGGAGGTDTGQQGNGAGAGSGGTQAAGGASGGAGGTAGGPFQGGSSTTGGAGGGGYYGGGGGGTVGGGGGGGGSSYTSNVSFALTSDAGGSGSTPGNTSNPFYISGVGVGGVEEMIAGNGEIVISYQSEPSGTPEPGGLALLMGAGITTVFLRARRGK